MFQSNQTTNQSNQPQPTGQTPPVGPQIQASQLPTAQTQPSTTTKPISLLMVSKKIPAMVLHYVKVMVFLTIAGVTLMSCLIVIKFALEIFLRAWSINLFD